MNSEATTSVRSIDRINLRLSQEVFDAIDIARSHRAGNVSRNTWIAEAIQEKLARDAIDLPVSPKVKVANA